MGLNKFSSFEDMANEEAQDASKKVEESTTDAKTVEASAKDETGVVDNTTEKSE